MEENTIKISLDKAQKWYRGNNEDLKQLALQAFTIEELENIEFKNIKTFYDALLALNITDEEYNEHQKALMNLPNSKHLIAVYKLDIIRQALNGKDFNPLVSYDPVVYPVLSYYTNYNAAKEDITTNITHVVCGTVIIRERGTYETYYIVGGGYDTDPGSLISDDNLHCGVYGPQILTCCKSEQIAEHMSKYFAKEIFNATNAQYGEYVLM